MKVKYILIIAVIIGSFLSLFASTFPDGLERVAMDQNFSRSSVSLWPGLIAYYAFPGVPNKILANFLTGFIGTISVYLFILVVSLLINSSKSFSKKI